MRENSNGYVPHPIDTTGIELPKEMLPLVDLLAKNCHENWSVGKMKAGFVYGEQTSNEKKTHADLKPYDELTEQEKSYDLATSLETVKTLLALGWRILPPEK